jgi:hypothetical protein
MKGVDELVGDRFLWDVGAETPEVCAGLDKSLA